MKTDEILEELGMDGPYPKSLYVSTMTERFGKRGYALPAPRLDNTSLLKRYSANSLVSGLT